MKGICKMTAMSEETKVNDFRLTFWKDPKGLPFAVVLTGCLGEKEIKVDIFKRSIHIYVNKVPQKRILCKNAQFIENFSNGNVDTEAVHAFLKMGRNAGLF
jgi:hypothetical protein